MSGHRKWSEIRDAIPPERRARIDALRAELEAEIDNTDNGQTDEDGSVGDD